MKTLILGDEVEKEEFLYPEEISNKQRTNSLRLYLKDIGGSNKTLLSQEEEIQISKTIENAYFEMAKILFSNDFGLSEFRKLFKKSKIIEIEKFIRIGTSFSKDVIVQGKEKLRLIMKQVYKTRELNLEERNSLTRQIVEFDLQYRYINEIEGRFRKLMEIKEDEKIMRKTGLSRDVLLENLREIDNLRQIIKSATEIMLEGNLRLSVYMAKKYKDRGVELSDLISVGNNGLRRAITTFDYRRKFKFSTYATWWIRQEMITLINQQGTSLCLPVNLQVDIRHFNLIEKELKSKLGRDIDPVGRDLKKIAKIMKVSPERVKEIVTLIHKNMVVSIESPIDGEGATIGDLIPQKYEDESMTHLHNTWAAEKAMEILERLREEKKVSMIEYKTFVLRYPLGNKQQMTLDEIGVIFNLSRERIRQIEIRVKEKLSYHRREIRAAYRQ
ncbi:MAG: sigma-70 family RNA polymerase sigma factor [Patescibacteria group bacterium]|nr:sigma-70 family RNA polymerase sigma factor [Patescibacteria group bacterium]MDD5164423.1 sigma-70 family RNA polymerase sigma factor [Patescibacteria group bacterium]MDD5534600.1 sigma-70 family RNA polymerase sigma factor [Patescibacteria group bacterium]